MTVVMHGAPESNYGSEGWEFDSLRAHQERAMSASADVATAQKLGMIQDAG